MTRLNMNLQDAVCTFIVIFHSILLKTRNASPCICRENQNIFYVE